MSRESAFQKEKKRKLMTDGRNIGALDLRMKER